MTTITRPCPRCNGPLEAEQLAGRSVGWCSTCDLIVERPASIRVLEPTRDREWYR